MSYLERPSVRIGIDTGGTFTDLVVVDEQTGERRIVKVPSTPKQPSAAVFAALDRALSPDVDVASTVVGTTIATNCLLQRKGQRTVYVTTAGFEDVPFIQRIDRKSLYDLQWRKPVPYVRRRDCLGVLERVAHDGSVRIPLESAEVDRLVEVLRAKHAESPIAIAINLLFAFVEPKHERMLNDAVREALPDCPVSVSHEVAPVWREYERASTVITDAYLRSLTVEFSEELAAGFEPLGVRENAALLKSNGGQVAIDRAARRPVDFILSGLAGGLIGAKHFAATVDRTDVLTLDMGGTSADVGVIIQSSVRGRNSYEFEWGIPIAIPVIDLSTVGAGGSSIAAFDPGGLLQVGPASAGADPGPAAYGRGAEWATVTDANVVLGRLNPEYFLGGELPLDTERARVAVAQIAEGLGCDVEQAAHSIIEVACDNMANAIRLLCADRGLDYRRFELMAFGGAGPLHASLLARRVGVRGVIVPPNPGLTSAFGAQAAELRVDRRVTRLLRSDRVGQAELSSVITAVTEQAHAELLEEGATDPVVVITVSCRYLGQNFEQDVVAPAATAADLSARLVRGFNDAHFGMYGYSLDGTVVEFVHFNATAFEARDVPSPAPLPEGDMPKPSAVRSVYFHDLGWTPTAIFARSDLPAGALIDGPAIIEEVDSTTLVLPGQIASMHASGTLLLAEHRPVPGMPAPSTEGILV